MRRKKAQAQAGAERARRRRTQTQRGRKTITLNREEATGGGWEEETNSRKQQVKEIERKTQERQKGANMKPTQRNGVFLESGGRGGAPGFRTGGGERG